MNKDYPLYVKWSQSLNRILDIVEKYPKSVRYTVSGSIVIRDRQIINFVVAFVLLFVYFVCIFFTGGVLWAE